MAVSFQNPGLIELEAIRTFGVSSKEGDNPIGFFGTGLKYAISVVLRLGGKITIYRGLVKHEFDVEARHIRNDDFNVVTMDGAPLGFTTDLGKTWEPWMGFRELFCNMLDEQGKISDRALKPRKEHTTVVVTRCPEMDQAYHRRGEIMLEGDPTWCARPGAGKVDVFKRASRHVFFRRLRAGDLEHPASFTYNITGHQELTEDRTLKNMFSAVAEIRAAIIMTVDQDFAKAWLEASRVRDSFEHKLHLGMSPFTPSTVFLDAVEEALDKGENINPSCRGLLIEHRRYDKKPVASDLTGEERAVVQEATKLLVLNGHPVDKYETVVVDGLGDGVLGIARREEQRILLSRVIFSRGMVCVVGTLLEEFLHLEYSLNDCSRGMQNHLVDLLATRMIPRGGRFTEPGLEAPAMVTKQAEEPAE